MARRAPLIGFGLFLKATRLGFHAVENYDGYSQNRPAYARVYEVAENQAILEVYTFEEFAKLKRPKRAEYIYSWWQVPECVGMLPGMIREHEAEFKETGKLQFEVPIPPAPGTT